MHKVVDKIYGSDKEAKASGAKKTTKSSKTSAKKSTESADKKNKKT